MKIYIAGIQGVGKTTLIAELKQKYPQLPNSLPSIGRTMKERGLQINELGGDETQIEAALITLEQTLVQNGVYSRSWLDGLVYTQYLYEKGQVSKHVFDIWKRWADMYQKGFDFYFYIRPEFPLEMDGVRSSSMDFYNRSKELMEQYVQEFEQKIGQPFHILTGSIENRIAQFESCIAWSCMK